MKNSFWKKLNTGWKILLIAGIVVGVFVLIALIYLADYHHAEEDALKEALSTLVYKFLWGLWQIVLGLTIF